MSREISLRVRVLALFMLTLGLTVVNWSLCSIAQAQTTAIVTLSVSPDSVQENAGTNAALVTATLDRILESDLLITLTNNDTTELKVGANVTIPAGQTAVTFSIDAVDDTEADGIQYAYITGTAPGAVVIGSTVSVLDDESAVTLSISPNTVTEDAGENAAVATLTRLSADTTPELTFDLLTTDPDLVTGPFTVTIPSGSRSTTFPIGVVDNDEAGGKIEVSFGVAFPNSTDPIATASITIIDDEQLLTLKVGKKSLGETAGLRATTATISRSEQSIEGELGVTLTSSDTSEIVIPPYVVIPDGQTSVQVPVGVTDDLEADGSQVARLTAAAEGFTSGSDELSVADNETPTLRLEIYGTSVNEGAGNRALVGVIHRNTPVRESISVSVRSSDTSEIIVPSVVVIPRGAESTTFPINAPQDSIVDPVVPVTITATRAGFRSSSASTSVFDDEGPSFRLRFENASGNAVKEDAEPVEVRVTRFNTSLASPQTVNISSSNSAFVTPQTRSVVIPANLASTTFLVDIGDNLIPEDTQWSTLTAAAGGFRSGFASLVVNDNEDPAVLTFNVDAPLVANPGDPTTKIPTISETAGATATYGTVLRNSATTSDVMVKVTSGLTNALRAPEVVIIPFGKTSVTFPLSAVDDLEPCPDPEFASVSADVAGFVSGTANVRVVDNEFCTPGREVIVTISPADIVETDGANAAVVTVTRLDQETNIYGLRVALTSSDPDRATVPTPVLIPRGSRSIRVPLSAIDNKLAEGCSSVTIAPKAEAFVDPATGQDIRPEDVGFKASFLPTSGAVRILDDEPTIADLTIRPSVFRESGSSGVATGTVTRVGTDLSTGITVNLSSTNPKEATVPATVQIPAGQRAASFAVTGVQDGKVDGPQKAKIVASVDCYTPELTAEVTVLDIDVPTLTLKIVSTLLESAGEDAGTAVVIRNTPTTDPLTVKLTSSEPGALVLPAEVTIPAGEEAVSFKVGVANDSLVLGTRRVTVTASRAGYRSSAVPIAIREDDVPQLNLSLSPTRVNEAAGTNASTGTVTRNTTTRTALTVGLMSNSGAAAVPLRVIIPAGATSATFPISVFDDGIKTAPRTAIITASARGFINGSATLTLSESIKLQGQNPSGDLSNAVARAGDGTIQLQFHTSLQADSAGDVGRYAVRVNGRIAEIEAVSYRATGSVVTLSLRVDALRAGDRVAVNWNGLLDAQGRELGDGATELTVR